MDLSKKTASDLESIIARAEMMEETWADPTVVKQTSPRKRYLRPRSCGPDGAWCTPVAIMNDWVVYRNSTLAKRAYIWECFSGNEPETTSTLRYELNFTVRELWLLHHHVDHASGVFYIVHSSNPRGIGENTIQVLGFEPQTSSGPRKEIDFTVEIPSGETYRTFIKDHVLYVYRSPPSCRDLSCDIINLQTKAISSVCVCELHFVKGRQPC
ncbi:hypothetical protein NP233_g11221 [Leucocoprinus birnbaumii]|uniref:Uncharacterized protein n=1 Tax=Leucocoprinus birnbaumii TaxID=56174 RepID=A0AAD5VJB0_9AGAR|nr:hypothetical protein NP233_g11221 [Leucocoprinus birnbaumii]